MRLENTTKVSIGSPIAILMLVCARIRYVAGTQWGNKKYMNMKHLEAAIEDVSIAG